MASNTASIEGCQQNVLIFADTIKKSLSLATAVATTLTTSGSITEEDSKNEASAVMETEAVTGLTEDRDDTEGDVSVGAVDVEDSDTDGVSDEEASAMLEDLSFMDEGTATVVELMIELMQTVVAMKEMYAKSSRADQEALSSQITTVPDAMRGYYGLFFNLFECKLVAVVQLHVRALAKIYTVLLMYKSQLCTVSKDVLLIRVGVAFSDLTVSTLLFPHVLTYSIISAEHLQILFIFPECQTSVIFMRILVYRPILMTEPALYYCN